MSFDPDSEATKRLFFRQVEAAAKVRVYPAVAGIAIPDTDITLSGLFVRNGRQRLIATAAHGIDGLSAQSPIHIFSRSNPLSYGHRILQLERDEDNDVALLQLGDDAADSLRAEWWDLSSATSRCDPPQLIGYMVGFPASRNADGVVGNRPVTLMKPFSYFTNVSKRASPSPGSLVVRDPDPELDILMEISMDRTLDDHTGEFFPEFDPKGMSGAGVFLLSGMRDKQLWSGEFVLAGIQSGHLKKAELLRATRIELVKQLAESSWPSA